MTTIGVRGVVVVVVTSQRSEVIEGFAVLNTAENLVVAGEISEEVNACIAHVLPDDAGGSGDFFFSDVDRAAGVEFSWAVEVDSGEHGPV